MCDRVYGYFPLIFEQNFRHSSHVLIILRQAILIYRFFRTIFLENVWMKKFENFLKRWKRQSP